MSENEENQEPQRSVQNVPFVLDALKQDELRQLCEVSIANTLRTSVKLEANAVIAPSARYDVELVFFSVSAQAITCPTNKQENVYVQIAVDEGTGKRAALVFVRDRKYYHENFYPWGDEKVE